MGDDAELYWEMEHDPFFWDQVESYNGSYSVPKNQGKKRKKTTQRKKMGRRKKEIQNNKSVDIVCIATSDKGYTETVKELRRQGKRVVGIGEKKAPKELRDACSEFIEIE